MVTSNLEHKLWLVRDGRIDYREFVEGTRREFSGMAAYLLRRWRAPEWFTLDDLVQELYVAAWRYVWDFDEVYGDKTNTKLSAYVTYNAISAAKRCLHKARGVKMSNSPDRVKSNIETPITRMSPDFTVAEMMMERRDESPPSQEESIIEREERGEGVAKALRVCKGKRERVVVLAIAEKETVKGAAQALYDDLDRRIEFRLHSEAHAIKFVSSNARAVASRLE